MVAFIDSVVAGAGVALLVDALAAHDGVGLALISGVASGAVLMMVFLMFQRWRFSTTDLAVEPPDA